MPTTKEFKAKHSKKHKPHRPSKAHGEGSHSEDHDSEEPLEADFAAAEAAEPEAETKSEESRPRRRPGRSEESAYDREELVNEFTAGPDEGEAFEIKFKGSELLRSRFPQSFKLADKVLQDWFNDGRFEDLPLGHPLAQWAAQQGLTRAKQIEKQILESPAFEKAAIQALTWGMKAQEAVQNVRGKFAKRKPNKSHED